jgi:hypothetical protein
MYVAVARNSVGYCYGEAPLATSPRQGICNKVEVSLSGLVISLGHRLPSSFRALSCRGYSSYIGHLQEAV